MSDNVTLPDPPDDSFDRDVQELELNLRQLHQRQKTYRWIAGASMLTIVIMIVVFGLSLRRSAERALDRDQLTTVAMERLEVIRPQIQRKLTAAALDAAPAYQEEASRRLRAVLPELERDVRVRLKALPDHVELQLNQKLQASLDRVAQEGLAEAAKTTPALSAGNAPRLAQRLRDELERHGYDLEEHVRSLVDQEKQKVDAVLVKFETEDLQDESADQLERRLIDRMLEVAQFEVNNPITVEHTLPPATPAAVELAPATRPAAITAGQE